MSTGEIRGRFLYESKPELFHLRLHPKPGREPLKVTSVAQHRWGEEGAINPRKENVVPSAAATRGRTCGTLESQWKSVVS